MYIRPIQSSKGFILSVDHSETFSNSKTHIDAILNKFKVLYCRDKKEILHYFPLKTLYDINIPPTTYIRPSTKTHDLFYSKGVANEVIPVVKHYELCEKIFDGLKDNITKQKTEYGVFFNS